MTDVVSRVTPTVPQWSSAFERVLLGSGLAVCLGLLAYKMYLVDRININWDEFLYLSQVHALVRGELSLLFQGAYAHLFRWVTSAGADEIAQIVTARRVMVVLLGLTAFLIWRLGRVWLEGFSSIVPPLVYLSSLPVVNHGGAFRADSLLAPLAVAGLLLAFHSRQAGWRDWYAGTLLGIAFAVTIKSALLLPMFIVMLACRRPDRGENCWNDFRGTAIDAGKFLLACGATAAILLMLHRLTIAAPAAESLAAYSGRVAAKTLFDEPLFAQGHVLQRYFYWQPLPWLLISLGTMAALFQRRLQLAALSLSLLPIVIYRNAFPYFYVVMLAPAVPLAGFAVQTLRGSLRARSIAYLALPLLVAIAAGLFYQTAAPVRHVREDDQSQQRVIVSAVHRIFPMPVPYVDRCGMIASFRKANFFMSTWGMETYRARRMPFMPKVIREHRPVFVLVNSPYLDPKTGGPYGLLPDDRDLIRDLYPVYWGPVRVAGAEGRFDEHNSATLTVPFGATYRLVSDVPVTIRGIRRNNGDLLRIPAEALTFTITADGGSAAGARVALFHADANAAPDIDPPDRSIFTSL